MNLITNNKLDLDLLMKLLIKPDIFEDSSDNIWTDNHVGKEMLKFHLDPDMDSASLKHSTIKQHIEYICTNLNLPKGASILDISCGPGLYCEDFCKRGFNVTGMDFNDHSLTYARKSTSQNSYSIEYVKKNYLTMDYREKFDVITLINRDFNALKPVSRDQLLERITKALKPGGYFIFDINTRETWKGDPDIHEHYVTDESDFWSNIPHILFREKLFYPQSSTWLEKYLLVEDSGAIKNFHNWLIFYDKNEIENIINMAGFQIVRIDGGLTGIPLKDKSEVIGIIAQKP